MKLIPDWKQAPKWFSVQALSLAATIQATWALIPDDLKASIPQEWVAGATSVILVLGVLGRILDQNKYPSQ